MHSKTTLFLTIALISKNTLLPEIYVSIAIKNGTSFNAKKRHFPVTVHSYEKAHPLL
ncbi:MAG: hypothetical protein R8K22_06305 [Mariprofundaceae bacterium]